MNELERDLIYKKYIKIQDGHHEHEEMLEYFHKNHNNPKEIIYILLDLLKKPPNYFEKEGRQTVFQPLLVLQKTKNALVGVSVGKAGWFHQQGKY